MKKDAFRIGASIALASLAGSLLAGCSGATDFGAPPDRLVDTQYALYFSAPSAGIDGEDGRGRVVLVDGEGSISIMPTAGMDNAQPVWTEAGLFFSDFQNDFRMDGTGLTVIDSTKADSQYGMRATSPSTVVGIYNLGFSDQGGYTSQVVVTSGDTSTLTEVEGGYYITAVCDGTVYGIGMATGPYSVTGDPDTEPVMFNQLTGTSDGRERNIGLSAQARDNAMTAEAPCKDGTIFYISDAVGGGLGAQVRPVVSMWDVDTGKYRELPLTAEKLDEPLMRSDGIGAPQVTADSIRGGSLQWFGMGNAIMSTDLKSGQTHQQFVVDAVSDDVLSSRAVFIEDEVVVMVDSDGSTPYELIRYDRDTGAEVARTTLDAAAQDVSAGLFLRGFAVRP